ncbi:MAG: hypothetical protein QXE51_06075 [Nitrososphaeria archaeon]
MNIEKSLRNLGLDVEVRKRKDRYIVTIKGEKASDLKILENWAEVHGYEIKGMYPYGPNMMVEIR